MNGVIIISLLTLACLSRVNAQSHKTKNLVPSHVPQATVSIKTQGSIRMDGILRQAKSLDHASAVMLGIAKSKYYKNMTIVDLKRIQAYSSFFTQYNASSDEFQRNRLEPAIKEKIHQAHASLLATPYFKYTVNSVKLGQYSFDQKGFPIPTENLGVFKGAYVPYADLVNMVNFDEIIAEKFVKSNPMRLVKLTFVFDVSDIESNFDVDTSPFDRMGTLLQTLNKPLYGKALFCVVENENNISGTESLVAVIPSRTNKSNSIKYYAKQAKDILEKYVQEPDLSRNGGSFAFWVKSKPSKNYFSDLESEIKYVDRMGIELAPEVVALVSDYQKIKSDRMQLIAKMLSNSAMKFHGKKNGKSSSELVQFSVNFDSYSIETGECSGIYEESVRNISFKGAVKWDNLGPLLNLNVNLGGGWSFGDGFRLCGNSTFCSDSAYFSMIPHPPEADQPIKKKVHVGNSIEKRGEPNVDLDVAIAVVGVRISDVVICDLEIDNPYDRRDIVFVNDGDKPAALLYIKGEVPRRLIRASLKDEFAKGKNRPYFELSAKSKTILSLCFESMNQADHQPQHIILRAQSIDADSAFSRSRMLLSGKISGEPVHQIRIDLPK